MGVVRRQPPQLLGHILGRQEKSLFKALALGQVAHGARARNGVHTTLWGLSDLLDGVIPHEKMDLHRVPAGADAPRRPVRLIQPAQIARCPGMLEKASI